MNEIGNTERAALKLTLKEMYGRVVCNDLTSYWKPYVKTSDFQPDMFHTPNEEMLLTVFLSYVENEDRAGEYSHTHIVIVCEDSGSPIIRVSRACSPNIDSINEGLQSMLDQIALIEGFEL
jgi:hypothetical protein